MRCAAHVLNLCVQDGLHYISGVVAPIRFVLNTLWSRKALRFQWYHFCKEAGVHPKKFLKDVSTRWNSTYKMIYELYEYRELLSTFANQHIDNAPLFSEIWINARDVMEVLKVFNDATYTFSLVYVPTSHIFLLHGIASSRCTF